MASTIPAGIPQAMPVMPARLSRASKLDGFQECDTQPLFYRARVAVGAIGALGKLDFFTQKKNAAPHLTNCEEAGSMPNTSGFMVAGIELVPNANCTAAAFKAMLASCRLMIEVGTKGIEKINQPAVFFGASNHTGAADNTATIKTGIYRLNPGEEISLEPDQPFRIYLQADDAGFTVANGEVLDFYIKLWGQKRGRVSLG